MSLQVLKITFKFVDDSSGKFVSKEQNYYVNIHHWTFEEYKERLINIISVKAPMAIYNEDYFIKEVQYSEYKDKYIMNFPTLLKNIFDYTIYGFMNPYVDLDGKETKQNKHDYV